MRNNKYVSRHFDPIDLCQSFCLSTHITKNSIITWYIIIVDMNCKNLTSIFPN